MVLDSLPWYLDLPDLGRYFLAINRDAFGSWSAAYINFQTQDCVCDINDSKTLDEVSIRMQGKLKRFKARAT